METKHQAATTSNIEDRQMQAGQELTTGDERITQENAATEILDVADYSVAKVNPDDKYMLYPGMDPQRLPDTQAWEKQQMAKEKSTEKKRQKMDNGGVAPTTESERRFIKYMKGISKSHYKGVSMIGKGVQKLIEEKGENPDASRMRYGKSTFNRIQKLQEVPFSVTYLRRCWRLHRLRTEFDEDLAEIAPSLKDCHWLELGRFHRIEEDERRKELVINMASDLEERPRSLDDLRRDITKRIKEERQRGRAEVAAKTQVQQPKDVDILEHTGNLHLALNRIRNCHDNLNTVNVWSQIEDVGVRLAQMVVAMIDTGNTAGLDRALGSMLEGMVRIRTSVEEAQNEGGTNVTTSN